MVAGALLAASAGALAVGIWSRGSQTTSTPATIIDGAEPTDETGNQAGSIAGPEAAEASHPPGSVAALAGDTASTAAATGDTASTGDTAAAVGLAASPAPASPTLASPEPGFSAPMVPGTIGRGFGAAPDRVGGSLDGDPGSVPSGSPLPPTADFDDRGLPEKPRRARDRGGSRAWRAPLRRRRARGLRADGRLGLRRPGHPGDRSPQHR